MAEPSRAASRTVPVPVVPLPRTQRATTVVTFAYMGVTLPSLAMAVQAGAGAAPFLVLHVAIMGCMLAAIRSQAPAARAVSAWLPLVAIPLLYAELPALIAVAGVPFRDPLVQAWEQALWNAQPARTLASGAPTAIVSELLHLAYLSYYAIIYLPLAYLWLRTRAEPATVGARAADAGSAFGEASLGVMLTFAICFVVFIVFPVQGPRYLWPAPDGAPAGPIRALVLSILERGSSRGAAFPSSHMAVAVVQALMAARWRIPGGSAVMAATLGMGVGAVYGGFHYGIDMVAGAVVGAAVFIAVCRWSGSARGQNPSEPSMAARAPTRR